MTTRKRCRSCGFDVDPQHTGNCPNCGNVGYDIAVTFTENVEVRESLDVVHEGERTKRSYPLLAVSIIISIVGSLGGYFTVGVWGVIFGIILGFVSFYVGMYAITKEKFRNHFHRE